MTIRFHAPLWHFLTAGVIVMVKDNAVPSLGYIGQSKDDRQYGGITDTPTLRHLHEGTTNPAEQGSATHPPIWPSNSRTAASNC